MRGIGGVDVDGDDDDDPNACSLLSAATEVEGDDVVFADIFAPLTRG